jgi:exodeoxyribonuclease VII small subunit
MAKKNEALTFEEALSKLEAIVQEIEEGRVGLEESIRKYEEGMAMVKHCRAVLSAAEEKIQKLQLSPQETLSAEPLNGEQTTEAEGT